MNKPKLITGITAYQSIALLNGQLKYMSQKYDVYLLAPEHPSVTEFCKNENAIHLPVNIERNPSVLKDLLTLITLIGIFYRVKPDIINLGTMKISFLGIFAAWLAGINKRIYTCRGFRFQDQTGFSRLYLIFFEKIISFFATHVICISNSIAELGIEKKIFNPTKVNVFAKGSSNGIDLNVFNNNNIDKHIVSQYKEKYNLHDKFIFGFVGRMVDAKGINELYNAFDKIFQDDKKVRLLMIGSFYEDQIKNINIIKKYKSHPGIVLCGRQTMVLVPTFMSMMDLLVLPTWREGFGNVLIQAAAMNIPVLTSNITGCKDAVNDGFNGKLIMPKSLDDLQKWMVIMKNNDKLRSEFAVNGKKWAENFDSNIIWSHMLDFYLKLSNEKNLP